VSPSFLCRSSVIFSIVFPWALRCFVAFSSLLSLCRFFVVSSSFRHRSFLCCLCFFVVSGFLRRLAIVSGVWRLGKDRLWRVGMASERRLGIGSKARRLECGGRNKVEALWVRVEDPAGPSRFQPVTSTVSCLGGEGRQPLASFGTQPHSRTTQQRLQISLDRTTLADIADHRADTAIRRAKQQQTLWHRLRP
jgi:hypothetical protein